MVVSTVNFVIALISMVCAVIYSGQSNFLIQKLNELFHWKTGCNPSSSVGNISLHYFSGRGRAEAVRLLLEDQHIPYTETKFTKENWKEAKAAGIESGIYTFGQVPAIITSKNKHLVQSKVILQFLGRSVGLDCDCRDLEICDMIAAGVDDLHEKRSRIMYNPDFTRNMRDEYVNDTLVTWFGYFNELAPHISAASDGLYFSSERLTWVDYLVFDMIDSNCEFIKHTKKETPDSNSKNGISCESLLMQFPRLRSFYQNFKSREFITSYMNNVRRPAYKIPYQPK